MNIIKAVYFLRIIPNNHLKNLDLRLYVVTEHLIYTYIDPIYFKLVPQNNILLYNNRSSLQ